MRRGPISIQPYKASADTAGDNALMLRFETADATVSATMPIRMMQQLHDQIGQLLEPRKITRAWRGQLNQGLAPETQENVVVEEEYAPGLGRASK